jgi:hypothetical protein
MRKARRAVCRRFLLAAVAFSCSAYANAQALTPGNWDVKSTAVELTVPGAPGFMLRMMRGKSKVEHKCVAPGDAKIGVATLVAPDPAARCTVERAHIADGRIDHVMACPQKKGPPMRIVRTGAYSATGFTARMTMTGETQKGPMRIVADQIATRTAAICKR